MLVSDGFDGLGDELRLVVEDGLAHDGVMHGGLNDAHGMASVPAGDGFGRFDGDSSGLIDGARPVLKCALGSARVSYCDLRAGGTRDMESHGEGGAASEGGGGGQGASKDGEHAKRAFVSVIVEDVAAGKQFRVWKIGRMPAVGNWTDTGVAERDVRGGEADLGEESGDSVEEEANLGGAGCGERGIAGVAGLCGAYLQHSVPWGDEDGVAPSSGGADADGGRIGPGAKHDVRAAKSGDKTGAGGKSGGVSHEVSPGPGGVDDPLALDVGVFSGEAVTEQDAVDASLGGTDGQDGGVIAGDGSGGTGFDKPVGHQALGEFALGVQKWIELAAVIGSEFQAQEIEGRGVAGREAPEAAVEPERGTNPQGRVTGAGAGGENELKRTNEVRLLAEKRLTAAKALAEDRELTLLKMLESSHDDAAGAAGGAGGEVIPLDEEHGLSGMRTLSRERHAIDSAAEDDHFHTLRQRATSEKTAHTSRLDARGRKRVGHKTRNSGRLDGGGLASWRARRGNWRHDKRPAI